LASSEKDPAAVVVEHLPFGHLLAIWIAIIGMTVYYVAINTGIASVSRMAYAMGRKRMLPSVLTLNHERVYIPNSTMLKEKIINITASNGIEVNIDFAIRYNENINRVLQQILKAIQDDVQEEGIEEPDILVREIRGDIIHARIKFRLLNPQRLEDARNRVLREVLKVLSTQGKT
jgi:small-conductance mechanosensitive channel